MILLSKKSLPGASRQQALSDPDGMIATLQVTFAEATGLGMTHESLKTGQGASKKVRRDIMRIWAFRPPGTPHPPSWVWEITITGYIYVDFRP